ncbi:hypothetical protein ACFVAJ_18265 [Agromyces sp. NPDC057679]|uniref:hypothetical protein n=1 Tax=Agromyces sp. NPDC057679 TaxID=3346207 RepID=UPI00366CE467
MRDATTWDELLGQMEADYEFASAGGVLTQPLWTAPEGLGPIPEELKPRAQQLLELQRAHLAELEEKRRNVKKELRGVKQVPVIDRPPVYLDAEG